MLVVGLTKIEGRVVLHHQEVTRERRLVEAKLLLDLFELLRIDALAAVIAATARPRLSATAFAVAELRHHLFDRPTRHELRDDKGKGHDADQGRHHQQQTSKNVSKHGEPQFAADGEETGVAALSAACGFLYQ